MNISINGEEHTVECKTLADLLNHLEHTPNSVATARNGEFVPLHERSTCVLEQGDEIEIIAPMSGG